MEPEHRAGHKTWQEAHAGNVRDAMMARNTDIVFLGDSIIEGWRGMSLGQLIPEKKPNIKVFDAHFDERKGAKFQGLALGLAGDKSYNLLWRIQNGELPPDLQPSIWWISIGTNDFGRALPHCSAEVVLLGIKRVVEELRRLRPGSKIVVNSVLPRSEDDLNGRLLDSKNPNRKTVWQGIMEVNRGLRDYCSKIGNVSYFDATSIFVRQDEGTKGVDGMYIPKDLMYDFLHPTAEGYEKWGDAIISKVHEVIDASQSEKGRLPLSVTWWETEKRVTSNQDKGELSGNA